MLDPEILARCRRRAVLYDGFPSTLGTDIAALLTEIEEVERLRAAVALAAMRGKWIERLQADRDEAGQIAAEATLESPNAGRRNMVECVRDLRAKLTTTEAEVERQVQVAARLASEAACERIRAEKAEAKLAEAQADRDAALAIALGGQLCISEQHKQLEAELARLRAALGNELSDDSPERHTYSTCTAGEGDQVNADRGCQRCAAWLALRGEGEK